LIAAALAVVLAAPAAATAAVHGVDVSHWQGRIAWPRVGRAGYRFAFLKATDGRRKNDWTYVVFRNGATAAHLRIGAYHMARPDGKTVAAARTDAAAEADHFVATARVGVGDLPPVLDLEHTGGLRSRMLIVWTAAWLDEVQRQLGIRAAIYTSVWFWRVAMADTSTFAARGHPLWIARWTRAAWPSVPASNWGSAGWTFWQWTDCGRVPGIHGCVDRDRFNGYALTDVLVPPAPVLVSPPSVGGIARVGETLTAAAGTWQADPLPTLAYSWRRCDASGGACEAIPEATEETYVVSAADAGHTLSVEVTATSRGRSAVADSPPTAPVE
jgi:lysozyme